MKRAFNTESQFLNLSIFFYNDKNLSLVSSENWCKCGIKMLTEHHKLQADRYF